MVTSFDRFKNKEDGALLVFFAMCCAAIFLIAALSFDLGKRASTQTELQSFADNVALAAAGELDGQDNAIIRAQTAANLLIVDEMTFGEGDIVLSGSGDFTLAFYQDLPDDEDAWNAPLDQSNRDNDALARFVRVQVNPVQVEWSFANILTLFSSDPLPNDNVVAEATGGYTSLACDIAPVFFCLPEGEAGEDWDPAQNMGKTILLRTGGNSAGWGPGNFGFLDVINMLDYDVTDTAGPCYGESGAQLYNCLIGAESALTLCFENGQLELLPGQRNGITPAVLNSKFDMYNATSQSYQEDSRFRPAPVVTKSYQTGSTCAQQAEIDINDATDFLPDDCFSAAIPPASCLSYDGLVRYGDGDWSNARLEYVDRNYSTDTASVGTVLDNTDPLLVDELIEVTYDFGSGDVTGTYHIDDPFRPFDATYPRHDDYASYPVLQNGAWRWHYYNAEVAVSRFVGGGSAYNSVTGEVDVTSETQLTQANWIDMLDVPHPTIPGQTINRAGTMLPHCASDSSPDPRRRTLVAAVVDCDADYNNMNGSGSARAEYFVEIFLQSVAGGTTTNGNFEIFVEIISEPLIVGDPSYANGVFRNLVQLYR